MSSLTLTLIWLVFPFFPLGWFAFWETKALLNKQKGDTFSEKVREWLKTDTPGGGLRFLVLWVIVLGVWVWFLPHILKWPI